MSREITAEESKKEYTYSHCPDCGTELTSSGQLKCYNCGFDFHEDEPTESESSRGIDPYDY